MVDVGPVVDRIAMRTTEIVDALSSLTDDELRGRSLLPGWDLLTIACHLRYGAEALGAMSVATIAGKPASYYPDGRDVQRDSTLRPRPGEDPIDVVSSLRSASDSLLSTWQSIAVDASDRTIREPEGRVDLGPLPLRQLPILRLTELEVHGGDLGLGLPDWSSLFVEIALPFRIDWLNRRRSNHRPVDEALEGTWILASTEGPAHRVTVAGGTVSAECNVADTTGDAVISASSRDLLALLLGRPLVGGVDHAGDVELASAFSQAFPGP